MNTITLDKQFFIGGNATFTVDNGQGEHYTFKIRQPRNWNGPVKPHFVSLLTGPDNTSSYTYLGQVIPETGEVKLTTKSRMNNDSVPVKVIRWTLKHVFGDKILPAGYQVRHAENVDAVGDNLQNRSHLQLEWVRSVGNGWVFKA